MSFQTLAGMEDVLPGAWPRWDQVLDTARRTAALYGYRRISTPILEPTALFARGVGEVTRKKKTNQCVEKYSWTGCQEKKIRF